MSNKKITVWLILLTAGVGFNAISGYMDKQVRYDNFLIRQQKFEEIYANMNSLEQFLGKKSQVDFTVPTIQDLAKGFMLSDAAQKKHLSGIKFTGRIINTQSVKHKSVFFMITVSEVSKEFIINQISSGNSTRFSVYIPNLKAEDARFAKIEYIRSMVNFLTK